jgi:hypothetical protein
MHVYQATERGISIALESGLNELADNIWKNDIPEALLFDITRQEGHFNPDLLGDQVDVERQAIIAAGNYARGIEEMRTLARGLEIADATDSWRYLSGSDQSALFRDRVAAEFIPAITQDRLVVSGVIGALLERYKTRYPLLARSRSAEYGFSNHMEACAFAGAYVVGRIMDKEMAITKEPSFEFADGNFRNEVSVGGTMHGDFRMSLTRVLSDNVISPANSKVEFSPRDTLWVVGYHTVEPNIIAAMITDEYSKQGATAAIRLISEFSKTLHELADDIGYLSNRVGEFADYGSRETSHCLVLLGLLLENPDMKTQLVREGKFYSAPSSAQTSILFEIKSTEKGLRFQDRDEEKDEPEIGIDIPRRYFPELFKTLVMQAQEGLGRTSPAQHLEILKFATEMLKA